MIVWGGGLPGRDGGLGDGAAYRPSDVSDDLPRSHGGQ
jgi:hypothetical protein